jgi:hypothetical protein
MGVIPARQRLQLRCNAYRTGIKQTALAIQAPHPDSSLRLLKQPSEPKSECEETDEEEDGAGTEWHQGHGAAAGGRLKRSQMRRMRVQMRTCNPLLQSHSKMRKAGF